MFFIEEVLDKTCKQFIKVSRAQVMQERRRKEDEEAEARRTRARERQDEMVMQDRFMRNTIETGPIGDEEEGRRNN